MREAQRRGAAPPGSDSWDQPAAPILRAFKEVHIDSISGVMQQTMRHVEIILVDSGPTDVTVAIVRQYSVQVVSLRPEPFSLRCTLNLGCSVAPGAVLGAPCTATPT